MLAEYHFDSRLHDPTTATTAQPLTDATSIFYLDGSLYTHFVYVVHYHSGSGGVIQVEIVAADDVAFATNKTVIRDSGAIDLDAADDRYIIECTAEEIAQESSDAAAALRYVTVQLDCAHADDKATVFIFAKPRFAHGTITTVKRQA